jgi:oligoendopeptidase F
MQLDKSWNTVTRVIMKRGQKKPKTNATNLIDVPQPRQREYLPKEFKLTVWSKIKPYFAELEKREINSVQELEQWISDKSELEAVVTEALAWRYIKITIDSKNQKAEELYQYAIQELIPRIASFENKLNKKMVESPFVDQLPEDKYYIHIRGIKNALSLFREENIPLSTEVDMYSKEYGKIFAEMTIGIDGKEMTLQKAGALLEEPDRKYREGVYNKINERILKDKDAIEDLFDQLLVKRHQIALNAGFENFRDYKFMSLGRFDYTVDDCLDFHNSIAKQVLPVINETHERRKKALAFDALRPWDLTVDLSGEDALRPFEDVDELTEKAISCLNQLDPSFGKVIEIMRSMGHLDLDSRLSKRPGGYNMPLHITGVPFIFMNASNALGDMRTLLHESGHAVHSYLTRHYKLASAKRVPSEVAELAAMSMELLTMDYWDVFFDNERDLRRAKINQLENVLKILPWIATIDKFQHWIYTHPEQTAEKRKENWIRISEEFKSDVIDFSGIEMYQEHIWHKQLHIFEVPFYYIEYGMAQLGAIAIWKRYKENPQQALKDYTAALELGYTKPISEVYQTAGIAFDFSEDYVSDLVSFIKAELDQLI